MAVLTRALVALAAATAVGLPAGAQTPPHMHAHRAIATRVPAAQADFDRGLAMLYAFNMGAAREAFRAAENDDPSAVAAYFGEAIADTVDINIPTTPQGEKRGADAVARGQNVAANAPADERALLAAAALRFDAKQPLKVRYTKYFDAMQRYAQAHPTDGLGLTLAAYAGWNALDTLTQGPADDLVPGAQRMADDLDAAIKLDPDDAGAHHLRIHFWEDAHQPERALSDATYLASLTYDLGQSHLPHMAAHIYDRVGDYAQLVAVNETACANDRAYFKLGDGPGQTYMQTYHGHDVAFVLYGLTTVGLDAQARAFAAGESDASRRALATRLHDSAAVLARADGSVDAMRVVAEARSGNLTAASRHLRGLTGADDGPATIDVARAIVARAKHDTAGAIAAYRKAADDVGTDLGDPKSVWQTPIGEGLGVTLLEAGKAGDAERVFRAERRKYPDDPHLDFGLAEALKAQGKDDTQERGAYTAEWKGERPLTLADLG